MTSTSRAQDASLLAAADLASFATQLGLQYRLLGGVAVGLLTWAHRVDDRVPGRETADADFGASPNVIADRRLAEALEALGYRRDAGNRFLRDVDRLEGPLELAVDLLIPAAGTTMESDVLTRR